MGGQACVFYGAAEFSRDTDFAILSTSESLARLTLAMQELQAVVIAVPPFAPEYLQRGHAIHFRCQHPEVARLRVDVMSHMRGVAPFEELWQRRTTLQGEDGTLYELMSLPDLVRAKKTQRDKDWPMIRRLIEADRAANPGPTSPERVRFWLQECRTPAILLELASQYPSEAKILANESRPLLRLAIQNDLQGLEESLKAEEYAERALDQAYWKPLKAELERLRHSEFSR